MKKKKKSPVGSFFSLVGRVISFIFNYGIPLKFVIIICAVLVAGSIAVTSTRVVERVGGNEDYDEARDYIEVKDVIAENYIREIDRSKIGASAAAAMVSGLGDTWSYYMTPAEYQTFQMSSANEYSGIGMSILKDSSGVGFQIVAVNSGSAADKAGLGVGMVITSVDGEDVRYMDYDQVRTLIRSRLNTKFKIGVGKKDEYTVDCASGYVSTVNYRKEKTEAGYVQLADFEAGSADDAIKAIEELLSKGIDALVIDVRNNSGGLTTEVQKLLDYLLPDGVLFTLTTRDGDKEVFKSDTVCLSIPMCVLVNRETFGEAEVFAAVLKEYHWATLMGETTSGMTRLQEVIELTNGAAIRLSTKTYLTAGGTDISAAGGVVPDSIVYNTDESATGTTQGTTGGEAGTSSTSDDVQLMQALTYLSKSAV